MIGVNNENNENANTVNSSINNANANTSFVNVAGMNGMSPQMSPVLNPQMSPVMNQMNQGINSVMVTSMNQMGQINQGMVSPTMSPAMLGQQMPIQMMSPVMNNMQYQLSGINMNGLPMNGMNQMQLNQQILNNNQFLLNNNQLNTSQIQITPEQLQQLQQFQQMQQLQFQQQMQQFQQMQQLQLQQQIQAINKQNTLRSQQQQQQQQQQRQTQATNSNNNNNNNNNNKSNENESSNESHLKSKQMKNIAKRLFSTHKKADKSNKNSNASGSAQEDSASVVSVRTTNSVNTVESANPSSISSNTNTNNDNHNLASPQMQQIQLQQQLQQLQLQQLQQLQLQQQGQIPLQGSHLFSNNPAMAQYNAQNMALLMNQQQQQQQQQQLINQANLMNLNQQYQQGAINNNNYLSNDTNNATNGKVQLTTSPIINDADRNEDSTKVNTTTYALTGRLNSISALANSNKNKIETLNRLAKSAIENTNLNSSSNTATSTTTTTTPNNTATASTTTTTTITSNNYNDNDEKENNVASTSNEENNQESTTNDTNNINDINNTNDTEDNNNNDTSINEVSREIRQTPSMIGLEKLAPLLSPKLRSPSAKNVTTNDDNTQGSSSQTSNSGNANVNADNNNNNNSNSYQPNVFSGMNTFGRYEATKLSPVKEYTEIDEPSDLPPPYTEREDNYSNGNTIPTNISSLNALNQLGASNDYANVGFNALNQLAENATTANGLSSLTQLAEHVAEGVTTTELSGLNQLAENNNSTTNAELNALNQLVESNNANTDGNVNANTNTNADGDMGVNITLELNHLNQLAENSNENSINPLIDNNGPSFIIESDDKQRVSEMHEKGEDISEFIKNRFPRGASLQPVNTDVRQNPSDKSLSMSLSPIAHVSPITPTSPSSNSSFNSSKINVNHLKFENLKSTGINVEVPETEKIEKDNIPFSVLNNINETTTPVNEGNDLLKALNDLRGFTIPSRPTPTTSPIPPAEEEEEEVEGDDVKKESEPLSALNSLTSLTETRAQQQQPQQSSIPSGFSGLSSLAQQPQPQPQPQQSPIPSGFSGLSSLAQQPQPQPQQSPIPSGFSGLSSLAQQQQQQPTQQSPIPSGFSGLSSLAQQQQQPTQQSPIPSGFSGLSNLAQQQKQPQTSSENAQPELSSLSSLAQQQQEYSPHLKSTYEGLNSIMAIENVPVISGGEDLKKKEEATKPQLSSIEQLSQVEKDVPPPPSTASYFSSLNQLGNNNGGSGDSDNNKKLNEEVATVNTIEEGKKINSLLEMAETSFSRHTPNTNENNSGDRNNDYKVNSLLDLAGPSLASISSSYDGNNSREEDSDDENELSNSSIILKELHSRIIDNNDFNDDDDDDKENHSNETLIKELEKTTLEEENGRTTTVKPIMNEINRNKELPELPTSSGNGNKKSVYNISTDNFGMDEDESPASAPVEPSKNHENLYIPRSVSAFKNKKDVAEEFTRRSSMIIRQLSKKNISGSEICRGLSKKSIDVLNELNKNGDVTREFSRKSTASAYDFESLHHSICSMNSLSGISSISNSGSSSHLIMGNEGEDGEGVKRTSTTKQTVEDEKEFKNKIKANTAEDVDASVDENENENNEKTLKKHDSTEYILKEFNNLFQYIGDNKEFKEEIDFAGIFHRILNENINDGDKATTTEATTTPEQKDKFETIKEEEKEIEPEKGENSKVSNEHEEKEVVSSTEVKEEETKSKEVEEEEKGKEEKEENGEKENKLSEEEELELKRKKTISKGKGKADTTFSLIEGQNKNNNANTSSKNNDAITNDNLLYNAISRSATTSNNTSGDNNNNNDNDLLSSNDYMRDNQFIAEQEYALMETATRKENDLLAILFSMGFENAEDNLAALRKANNDIDQAVNYLIEEKIPYDVINDIRENDFLEETENLRRRYQQLNELNDQLNQNYPLNSSSTTTTTPPYEMANRNSVYRFSNNGVPSLILNPNESYIVQNYNGNNSIVIDNNELNRILLQQQQQQQQQQQNEPPAPEYPGYSVIGNNGVSGTLINSLMTTATTTSAANNTSVLPNTIQGTVITDNNPMANLSNSSSIGSQDHPANIDPNVSIDNGSSIVALGNRVISEDVTSIVYNGGISNNISGNRTSVAYSTSTNQDLMNNRMSLTFSPEMNNVNVTMNNNNNNMMNNTMMNNNNTMMNNNNNMMNNNNNMISNNNNMINNNNNMISNNNNMINNNNNNRLSNARVEQLRGGNANNRSSLVVNNRESLVLNRDSYAIHRDSNSIICNMSNSEIMNVNSDDEEEIETCSEFSEEIISQRSTLPRNGNTNGNVNNINVNTNLSGNINGNVNELLPMSNTTTTTVNEDNMLQSPSSHLETHVNSPIDSVQGSLDSPSVIPANINDNGILNGSSSSPLVNNMININNVGVMPNLDNQVVLNQLSLPRNAGNTNFDSTNQQTYQLNAQIQQNQQQIIRYQNKLHEIQERNNQIERLYSSIQNPPEQVASKLVTWYPKWTSRNSPFGEKIVFSVKLNNKNENTLITTLKKRRNDARASPDDHNKIVLFCNHLFNSMKYIQNEQSDILNDALKLLKKSVRDNSIDACNILAKLYIFGIEGALYHEPNYDKAGPLFMKVLKNTEQQQKQQLNSESTYNLGLCYEHMDSKKKRMQAISFFKFAAINNHPGAAFKMYKIYERKSPKEAVKWLNLSKRNANKEYPDGLYEYALLSYKGYESGGISKNEDYTIALLKEAADKYEHIPSALELGKFYLISEGNTSTNAGKYLHMAAAKDNKIAQYKLASWWDKQPVTAEMRKKAYFDWLSCAAEGKEGLPEAM